MEKGAGIWRETGLIDDDRLFPPDIQTRAIARRLYRARRIDCGFLAELVAEHQLNEDEAHELARALSYDLAKKAYKL